MTAAARICPVCGAEFVPTTNGQRYCPPRDQDRERQKQPRSRCARRAINHAQRTREGRKTIPLAAPLPQPFDCAQCGKRCTPGGNVPPHATRFCGRRCKKAWHRSQSAGPEGQP